MNMRGSGRRRKPLEALLRCTTGRIERACDRVIEWCDRGLMGGYRLLQGRRISAVLHRIADAALLLRFARGMEAHLLSGPAGRVVLVALPRSLAFLRANLIPDAQSEVSLGCVPLWKLRRFTDRWLADGVELVVAEVSRLYPEGRCAPLSFRVPTWINQELTVPGPVEELVAGKSKRGLRGRINRAARSGFGWRHSRDPQDFDLFHYEMYVPSARLRHGALAVISPYAMQRWWFERHGLLLITENGEPIAGTLTHVVGDTCISVEGGVRGGDAAVYRDGGDTYSWWANMQWAREHGATRFNMGGSRPLRSNGSFVYKREWGGRVVRRQRPYGHWLFQSRAMDPVLRQRINALGVVAEHGNEFRAVWLANDDADDLPDLERRARKDGLDGLRVIRTASRFASVKPHPDGPMASRLKSPVEHQQPATSGPPPANSDQQPVSQPYAYREYRRRI